MPSEPQVGSPVFCQHCNTAVEPEHWFWSKSSRYTAGGRWICRVRRKEADGRYRSRVQQDPDRHKKYLEYQTAYSRKHPEVARFKAYKSGDRLAGRDNDLLRVQACALMAQPCAYCGVTPAGGLDRKDSALGHTVGNSLPACEICNFILGDLPLPVKEQLSSGLRHSRETGLLDDWVIPTKRHLVR